MLITERYPKLGEIGKMKEGGIGGGAGSKPWLSAIVPSHNGERWLEVALDSVVAQRDAGIEVVVVDSSDTEASLAIVNRYSAALPIRAYRRRDLLSWMAKTNFAVGAAAGDWVCMLHQDDLWLPNRSAAAGKWIAETDGIMHLHAAFIIDAAGRRLGRWRCPLPAGDHPVPAELLLERLLVQNFVAIPTPTIRREAYLQVGGLDEQLWYTADWDLYLKLSRLGDIYYHHDYLAGFRIHRGSLTMSGSRSLDEFRDQMDIVLHRHIGALEARQRETLRLAAASIAVNIGLAAASLGRPGQLIKAGIALLALGPHVMRRYATGSRIFERALPRVRARIAGRL